jgi:cholesterol oxidase
MKSSGVLPHLSDRLGQLTRTNSEALLGAMTRSVPANVDLTRGIAITTSFHPDAHTHIENVRYGKGSDAMGALVTLLADGRVDGRKGGRIADVLKQLRTRPGLVRFLVPPPAWRFAERSIIGLVMQSVDNSITVRAIRRRWGAGWRLSSEPGYGTPSPRWIPAGHRAIRRVAEKLQDRTGLPTAAGAPMTDLVDIPMTAHFIGGCAIGASPQRGVVDAYHRVWGYPGLHIVDGSTLSANLGVNPSLTITAQAERAFALWPNRGDPDLRAAHGEPYQAAPAVEASHPAVLTERKGQE